VRRSPDGNNCIAYADLETGKVPAKISSAGKFDYRYDHSKPATNRRNLQASLVGMFFHVNLAARPLVRSRIRRSVRQCAKRQFRAWRAGTAIQFSAEGKRSQRTRQRQHGDAARWGRARGCRCHEFTGCRPLPSRTSNHEALITFHEMGHYITNRLIGNATGC
jgi:hypothetical protein